MSEEAVVAIVRTTCPTCGDVEMTIGDLRVRLCSTTDEGSYAFRCPSCRLLVSKPIETSVVDVLVLAGVELVVWQMPAELDEHHSGPPVSYDDLLEFHFQLQQVDCYERLAGAPGRPARDMETAGSQDGP
jgi:hypothetical protein